MKGKGHKLAAFAKGGKHGKWALQRQPTKAVYDSLKQASERLTNPGQGMHPADLHEHLRLAKLDAQEHAQTLADRGHGTIQTGKNGGKYYVAKTGEKHYIG